MTEEKTVLEAFRRTVTELVHLTIGGEVITTTHNHPFYVAGKGFVNAGKLRTSDKLLNKICNQIAIADISFESTEAPTEVYNIKVEDYHSYYVCNQFIYVHNADCTQIINDVESGKTKLETTQEKGNYGEMKMDQELRDQGYTRVSADTVDSLNSPGHQGIDGVYYKEDGNPQYIIGEAKYGSSRLSTTKDGTRQMSDKWINERLNGALGDNTSMANTIADEMILNPENVGTNLYHISPDGSVETIPLDSSGNKIR